MQTELKSEMLGCPSRSYNTELKLVEKKWHNIKTILPLGSIARSEDLSLFPSCSQDWCSPRVFEEERRGQQWLFCLAAGEIPSLDRFCILTPCSIPPALSLT